jgi:hypothetical protein
MRSALCLHARSAWALLDWGCPASREARLGAVARAYSARRPRPCTGPNQIQNSSKNRRFDPRLLAVNSMGSFGITGLASSKLLIGFVLCAIVPSLSALVGINSEKTSHRISEKLAYQFQQLHSIRNTFRYTLFGKCKILKYVFLMQVEATSIFKSVTNLFDPQQKGW